MDFRSNSPTTLMLGSREFLNFKLCGFKYQMDTQRSQKDSAELGNLTGFSFKEVFVLFFVKTSLEIVGTCNLCYLICINIMIFSEDNLQSVDFGVLHLVTEILKRKLFHVGMIITYYYLELNVYGVITRSYKKCPLILQIMGEMPLKLTELRC